MALFLSPLFLFLSSFISITLLCSLLPLSSAHPSFRTLIPNGLAADTFGTGLTCVRVGHLQCDPATATSNENNAFGLAFKAAGFKWTKELCEADSDGDGQTNGAELGDPCCEWDPELGNDQVLRKTDLSNPGDASETNSAEGCVTTPTDTAPVPSPAMATESATPSSSMQPATATAEGTPSVSTSASSTDDSGSDDDVCFPGSVTVKLSDGSSKKMGDIIVGDIVQVAHPSTSVKDMDMYTFSPVLGFSHRLPDVTYNHFVTISASDGSSITLTSGHYMYAPDLKRARDVRTGDVLPGDRIVVDVVHGVEDKGLFNPHTETGTIVVNGMVSSCYTESVDVRTAHALLVPVRGMWKVLPKRWRDAFGLDIKDNGSVGLRALLPLIRSSKM